MKTTRKGTGVLGFRTKKPIETKKDDGVPQVESKKPSAISDGTTSQARKAIQALGLEMKGEASGKSTKGAKAASLGEKLMNALKGDAGKKGLAMIGLGITAMSMAPGTVMAAEVQVVDQQVDEQAQAMFPKSDGPASPWMTQINNMTAGNVQDANNTQAVDEKPDIVLENGQAQNSSEIMFRVPSDQRDVKDGQSVLIPLEEGRTMHMVELKYQDTRKLKDLEFNRTGENGQWEKFRGDEFHETESKEKAGELKIKRESDHNSPWINNPIRVKVDIVDAEGEVIHTVGKKFVDFHVHDAHSPDSSGYPETDNINNTYDNLPKGELPEGSFLRLTPVHEGRGEWEQDREVAMDLSWVKPIYMPEHTERASIREGGWEKPAAEGYDVEAGRPIAGVFVKWTDHGGSSSGRVNITQPDGSTFRSQRYNVGSGETELIPLDGVVSQDGKLKIEGYGLEVGNIEVLYQ
jgi:hypothetical protein